MPQDDRDVLQVLKSELNFVQNGGYDYSRREPFNAQLIFEDSPTCMNFDTHDLPGPCAECLLMQFVPSEKQGERVPCRHIPLTSDGQTVFDLYQGGATQPELEGALIRWLREMIAQIEAAEPGSEKGNPTTPIEGVAA